MRPRLFGIAYRMLQTRADAEEVVQEAWMRLARADQVTSVEGFLLRVTTTLCLDREKSASVRRERYFGSWLPELVDTAPRPDDDIERLESLNLGLLHVLLTLPPVERAVFLLREAFDYPYDQIAVVVDRKPDACRQIARRARDRVRSTGAGTAIDEQSHEELLSAFLRASQEGDTARLESLLAEDVVLISDGGGKVVAAVNPIVGVSRVTRFLVGIAKKAPPGTRFRLRSVNGAPAAEVIQDGAPSVVFQLDIDGGVIRRVFAVSNPDKLTGLEPLSD